MLKSKKKSKKAIKSAPVETLIGKNAQFVGDVHFTGGLHLDGNVKGNIFSSDETAVAIISERGSVEGEVRVPKLLLDGKIVGDVHTSELAELHPNAQVTGDVYYNMLEMSIGAEVNGKMVHVDSVESVSKEDKTVSEAREVVKTPPGRDSSQTKNGSLLHARQSH